MDQLQPQPEVITSSLVRINSTSGQISALAALQLLPWNALHTEEQQVDWLILHFNYWFSHHNVMLVRGEFEPEYFPATDTSPARIQFAHGFFNSALHEISHWTIAGKERRLLADLGYWYAPDGRTREQQALFEQVEVKPQAIEWLFATAFGRKFRVSLDNLTGESGNGNNFKDNVYAQVCRYMNAEACLPKDAWYLISCICTCIRGGEMLQASEFKREMLD